MIYITGDTHADFSRFRDPALRKLHKQDALIICGDFGFIWDGSDKEKKLLKKIGKLPYNVLFVEGSHENYDLLEEYEVSEWCGGKTRLISGRLRQLMRGQVFEIAERTVFTFGGGQSDDPYELSEMTQGVNWWERELPNEEELTEGRENLEKADKKVDFVISYEPPAKIQEFITGRADMNNVNVYLNEIYEKAEYKDWFFGKLHLNKLIPPKYHAVYDKILAADTTKIKKKKEPKKLKDSEKLKEYSKQLDGAEKFEESEVTQEKEN